MSAKILPFPDANRRAYLAAYASVAQALRQEGCAVTLSQVQADGSWIDIRVVAEAAAIRAAGCDAESMLEAALDGAYAAAHDQLRGES